MEKDLRKTGVRKWKQEGEHRIEWYGWNSGGLFRSIIDDNADE